MKKALILDLDNTIYPVSDIAAHFFKELFSLLDQHPEILDEENNRAAKDELQRRPYHVVAEKFNFGPELTARGLDILKNITYDQPMQPFADYEHIRSIPLKKFLVTTGFSKWQRRKVQLLGIENDFQEVHVVDPELSTQTKKDVFSDIMERHGYSAEDLLVIGDDPESEIKAAKELGIDTFLFDPEGGHDEAIVTFRSDKLRDAMDYIGK
jgi:putative hydrolase of the HAD superfamily